MHINECMVWTSPRHVNLRLAAYYLQWPRKRGDIAPCPHDYSMSPHRLPMLGTPFPLQSHIVNVPTCPTASVALSYPTNCRLQC